MKRYTLTALKNGISTIAQDYKAMTAQMAVKIAKDHCNKNGYELQAVKLQYSNYIIYERKNY